MNYIIPFSEIVPSTFINIPSRVETGSVVTIFTATPHHVDEISYMETFSFPDLEVIKLSLEKSNYSEDQKKELILGLKTLPEYNRD